jgi:hypothetical protein
MKRGYVDVTEFGNLKENCNVQEKKTSKDGKIHAQMLPLVIFMRHGQAFRLTTLSIRERRFRLTAKKQE